MSEPLPSLCRRYASRDRGSAMTEEFHGRRVLVTGGSRGIGLDVSRALAQRGASVAIAARDRGGLEAAVEKLYGSGHLAIALDVSDHAAWPTAMARLDTEGPVHGLVAAAGVLGPIGPLDAVDPQAFAEAIGINLLGTMLALHHTLPRLRATRGRAVTFSGGGATSPLPRYDAYAASKAAVVRLTENVALNGAVEINAVAPGFVATKIHEGTMAAGPAAAGEQYHARTELELARGGFPASGVSDLVCFLLSQEAAGISGRLVSAQWDPWREQAFRDQLRGDETLGTLRRIDGMLFSREARASNG